VTIAVVKSGIPRPLANYNEAFVVGDLIFAAGQLASDFKTGVPPEARKKDGFPFYGSDIELQTTYILENLKKTFEAAGSSLDHVVKAQVFLTDLNLFHGFDSVWKRYFKQPPPRTTIGCTGLLVKDTLVEIDLIGYVPSKARQSGGGGAAKRGSDPHPTAVAVLRRPPSPFGGGIRRAAYRARQSTCRRKRQR